MQNQRNYKDYTDFLNDEDFVMWQLTKDIDLNNYWNAFIEQNPHMRNQFDEACSFFSKISMHKEKLNKEDKEDLLLSIKNSLYEAKKKRTKRRTISITFTAACLLLGLVLSPLFRESSNIREQEYVVEVQIEQKAEDKLSDEIYIITSSGATQVQNNANIQIQSGNTVSVQGGNSGDDKLLNLDDKQMNKIIVPYGKRATLTLSDGTNIWLSPGSTLEFPSQFVGGKREVQLTGEIYADVAKNEVPFIVHTSRFDVKVYGTKFNISAYDNAEEFVVLESGSVGVKSANKKEIDMKPREMLVFDAEGETTKLKNVNISQFTSWKDGYLILNNTSMVEILKRIERYYNLSLSYDNDDYEKLKNKTCTGRIILSENVDNVLTTFALLSRTKYEKENRKILINVEP